MHMDGNKWAEIREENRAIMENLQQYLATLNTRVRLLIPLMSKSGKAERS